MLLCIGAFRIIFLRNERLLIAFLVRLICYMVLPHYCAVRLKGMYFNFTAYIFLYKYITSFPRMYFTTLQRAIYFTRFSPTLIHFSLFRNNVFSQILDFVNLLRTLDFSRVNFATELSTNLVYISIFVIDFNYISIHLLFFFTVKLSIFNRLCVKHKRVMNKSTH